MIRRTNRLSAFLASNGHGVRKENWEDPFVEAEFVGTESATAEDSGVTFSAITPEFDVFVLNQLMAHKVECVITEQIGDGPTRVLLDENDAVLQCGTNIDILWLSEDKFVTRHSFEFRHDERRDVTWLCDMKVKLSEVSVGLKGYRLRSIEEDESKAEPSSSGLPFRFLTHMLAQKLHLVSKMELFFGGATPVDAVLSVIPTTAAENITKDIEVSLRGDAGLVVWAMADRPIHRHVVLCLDGEFSRFTRAHIMNIVLRRYPHRLRLHVPVKLWKFEPVGETFAANSAIESLTFSELNNRDLSPKLLNGLSRNQGLMYLTIVWDIDQWSHFGFKCPPWIVDVFRAVWRPGTNLRLITVKFNYYADPRMTHWDDDECYYDPVRAQREVFEQVALHLNSDLANGRNLSILQLACNGIDYKKSAKSNCPWDARFSLGVAINWLHCQQVPPSLKASGVAVRSINQCSAFTFSTNLGTWDPATSRASAIYDILRPWMGDI
jgi:hypothetical protein